MNKAFLFLLVIFLSVITFSQEVNIVPQPGQVKLSNGFFNLKNNISFQVFGIQDDFLKIGMQQLKDEFKKDFGIDLAEGKSGELKIGKPGKNHIMLQIDNWKAGWGFSFRLQDFIVRNHKHKYKILD